MRLAPDVNPHGNALVHNSHEPIYHQMYELLRDRILSGEFKPGDLLPAEPELMAIYDVSRITVRKAVELLSNENLVYKRRGKGTFVRMAMLKSDASRILSFEQDMQQRGFTPATKLLETKVARVSHVTAEKLGIQTGDELVFIKLQHFANGEPILLEEVYLVHRYCPGVIEQLDLARQSISELLEREYDIRIERATQTISAMVATESLQELMNVSDTQALIYIEDISYSQLDIAVQYRRMHYRADRYALELALKR